MVDNFDSVEYYIEKTRLDHLYVRSKVASIGLFVSSAIYVLILSKQFDAVNLVVWFLILSVVLAWRWFLFRRYREDSRFPKSLPSGLAIFRLGIFITGSIMGSLNIFFFPQDSLYLLLIAILFPYGIAMAAVTMLLDVFSFALYLVTLLSPVLIQSTFNHDLLYSGTSIMTVVLGAFLLKMSLEYNRSYVMSTRLRYENKKLLKNLEEEKNKLSNRLGRILNDSTTEIYVIDADTLKCLQVNQGALDNLGYSQEEFARITLLDIFTTLDRKSLFNLIEPLHNGRWEPVKYRGINRRKDGTFFPVEASLQLSTADNPPIIVANVQDITERTKWEEKLIYQANYDQLTGIYNRHYIQSYMHSVFTRARRLQKKVALLFLDLDHFKDINDTLGHDAGDEIIRKTANRIQAQLRESDVVARTGGDEFIIFLENLENKTDAEVVARKLINIFEKPFYVRKKEIHTTVTIGISVYPDDGDTHEQLMQCADMAMYQAKSDGRNTYHFFSQEMRRISEKQLLISNHLRYALAKNEISLFFQPKIDITLNQITGAEALLRWHNPELGDVPPSEFIPLAENIGIISELGAWVLQQACNEAMKWQGLTKQRLQVSVNVSPQQFRIGSLLKEVKKALTVSGLPSDQLELEITESLLLQDSEQNLSQLRDFADQGIRLSLDDFGTGYSSLSYVRRFPLHILKIDRSFIHGLENDLNHKVLVDAIIAMARSLNLELVAEGVENKQQLEFLRQRGVRTIQGYIISPPLNPEDFRKFLKNEHQSSRSNPRR